MIRKSFRIGLKLGLLAAIVMVIAKVVQSRGTSAVAPTPAQTTPSWPPVEHEAHAHVSEANPESPAERTPATRPTEDAQPAVSDVATTRVRPLKAVRKTSSVKGASSNKWVEPNGNVCPSSHPVKGKVSSKIFHVLGGRSYDRTNPDRCYETPADAEADGLRAAKY